MHHKLETIEVATTATDHVAEEVAKAAIGTELSQEAIMKHVRRLQHMEFEATTMPGGGAGVRLGRIEIPQSNYGVVGADGWRRSTVGPNAVPVERFVDGGAGAVHSVPNGKRRDILRSMDAGGDDYETRIRELEAEVARLRMKREGK